MITGDLPGDESAGGPRGHSRRAAKNDWLQSADFARKEREEREEREKREAREELEDRQEREEREDLADEAEQEEFAESDEDQVSPDIDEFDDQVEDAAEDIDAVVELSSKEQCSKEQGMRSLLVRRAIEARTEKKKLAEDVDYLDMDFDD